MTAHSLDGQIELLTEFLEPVEIVDNVCVDIDWIQLDATDAKEILASLRELKAAQWQPIETAPKDVFVFLWCPEDKSRWLAKWQGNCWYGVDDEGLTRQAMGSDEYTGWKITHWRSLPAPPIDAAGKEGE